MKGKVDNFIKKIKEVKEKDSLDLSLGEDLSIALMNLISLEEHFLFSFVKTSERKYLKWLEEIRELRKKLLKKIVKKVKDGSEKWCFVPGTKVITDKGLKNIEEIIIGDNVLTHKKRFKKITRLFKRNYNGEIVKIYTNYTNIPLEVTGNHLFFIADNLRKPQKDCWKKNYKEPNIVWKSAEKLTRNDFLFIPRYNFVKNINKMSYTYKWSNGFKKLKATINFKVGNELMRIMGWYLSEGHYSKNYIGFSFGKKEEDLTKRFILFMKSVFNYSLKPKYRKSTIEFSISKRNLIKFFKQFGEGAKNKKIPSWVINLPNKKLIYLIKGMMEGDGSVRKFDFQYCSISKELAYNLRLILNKLGIVCNLSNRGKCKNSFINNRKIISKNERYMIQISGDSARKLAKLIKVNYYGGKKTSGQYGYIGKDYFLIPILKIEKTNYAGKLYNLEVEEDESYCTFNGVAHNCISKHLLATTMRLTEVGTKYLHEGKKKQAEDVFYEAFNLYSLFWVVNGVGGGKIKEGDKLNEGKLSKISKLIKKILDCCKE